MKLKDLMERFRDLGIDPNTCEEEIGVEIPMKHYPMERGIERVEVSRNVNPNIRLICEPNPGL